MRDRFDNRVIVVTGGSTGIGFAIAEACLNEKAKRVYITGRTKRSLELASKALGERAVGIVSDVSNIQDLTMLSSSIESNGDKVDVLFANAGIAEKNQFEETTEQDFARTFDINVKGVFFSVQLLLPLLSEGSSVVLTSSITGNKGMENLSLYNASKASVRSFARTWANELKSRRIRVNTLSPGFTNTPIMKNGLKMNHEQIAQLAEHAKMTVPVGYVAPPEEIAAAALFLASQDARYVNGVELTVDGGYSQI